VRLDPRLQTLVLAVHILALCIALGPLVFFGAVVAPASFRILPTHDMAGALQSPILSKLCLMGEASFLVLFGTSWLLTGNGAAKLTRSLLTRLPILGFFAAIVIRQLLIPQIDRIRVEAAGLIDSLPAGDPSRLLLDRYHRMATGFFSVEIAAALILVLTTARLLSAPRIVPPAPVAVPKPAPKILDL